MFILEPYGTLYASCGASSSHLGLRVQVMQNKSEFYSAVYTEGQPQWLGKTALLPRSSPRRRSKARAPDAKRAGTSRGWVVRMRIRSAMDPYERVLSCTVGSTASFGRQVRAPAVCPQNSVESPRTPPHSRRIVSCACAGPVGRAPTVAKELAESAALSSLASYSAARCTAQLLTRQALVRRAEAILFGLDQAYQPSGLPRVAPVVTFQLMECADDAIKALFAADGARLKGKVSGS